MNKIIAIGYLSDFKCYLNISKEEATKKYLESEEITQKEFDESKYRIYEIEFDDEFSVYDIWE